MGITLNFLKDFEYYCENEDALQEKIDNNKPAENFRRVMKEIDVLKSSPGIMERYAENIKKAEEFANSLKLVHNTDIDCLTSIIECGSMMSIDQMEKEGISLNYRITSYGIQEEMFKYVFCSIEPGNWINGQCRIIFKGEIEKLQEVKFLPQSHLCYNPKEIKKNWMEFKNSRKYLAEHIAVNFEEPEDYLKNTPCHKRPEFLFEDCITLSYVEEIICATHEVYSKLTEALQKKYGGESEVLKIIKYGEGQVSSKC